MKPEFTSMPSPEELKREAQKYWSSLPEEFKSGGYNEERGKVNYLRHRCTNYEGLKKSLKINGGTELEITQLKKDILTLIMEGYPDLKAACLIQMEQAENRKHYNGYSRNKYFVPELQKLGVVDLITPKIKPKIQNLNANAEELEKLREENARLKEENQKFRSINLGSLFDNREEIEKLEKENAEYSQSFGKIASLAKGIIALTKRESVSVSEETRTYLREIGRKGGKISREKGKKSNRVKDVKNRILHLLQDGPKHCQTLKAELGGRRYHYPLSELIKKAEVTKNGDKIHTVYALAVAGN
jgi:hypothetical protein